MNRREFLALAAAFAGGCQTPPVSQSRNASGARTRVVDAGPVHAYDADGVYTAFQKSGFFIVKSGGKLVVLSSFCTHRRCELETETDRSFSCPCHGSAFSPQGKVTEGPAVRDLPIFASVTNEAGHLLVTVPVA